MARPSRVSEERKTTERVMPRTRRQGRLYVDRTKIPTSMKYRWVRENLLNEPDDNNMVDAMQDGWKPVPGDRHPELLPPALPGRERDATVIRRGGLILMELPKEIAEQDREALRQENMETMQSIAWSQEGGLNDTPLITQHNQTSIERVREFKR